MNYLQSSRLLHHTITTTQSFSFSVPSTEEIKMWSIYDLGYSEIGVQEATKQVYMRIGSDIIELTNQCGCTGSTSSATQSVNPQLNGNIPSVSIATPTFDQAASVYDYDMGVSGADMFRFDSYATVWDTAANKYYSWQHVAIVKDIAGTHTLVRQYYTKEDLDGQSTDIDFVADITASIISFGFIRPSGSPITGDAMAYTNISYM
jgi:hypothetical protein